MSATREHRNAIRVEDSINRIGVEIDTTVEILRELASVLPDDYPMDDVDYWLTRLAETHQRLTKVAM